MPAVCPLTQRHALTSPCLRRRVQLLLRERWSELGYNVSLTQLDSGWNLFYLGEAADYLLGLEASRRWQQLAQPLPAGTDAFEAKLQVMREMLISADAPWQMQQVSA